MQGLYPYPPNPLAEGISSIGQFLPLLLAFKKAQAEKQFQAQPLGTVLGYPNQPVNAPTPGPIASMPGVGPTIPTASPANFLGDEITAKPNTTFTGAPAGAQPLLSQPVSTLARLRAALGDQQTTNLMSSLGLGKKYSADSMDLEYDPETGSFKIPEGKKAVSTKAANIILRQKDIANKRDLTAWRDAVEKRLGKGQLAREESISLRADADLLNFMVSPQFDLMDDTLKEQFKSQAAAAVNRLQQRGVNVYTGSRKSKVEQTTTPTTTTNSTGLLTPGNIDLQNRPTVQNADGSQSSVRTITVDMDGKTILLPTVINGKIVSNADAVANFRKTGQHMGIFKNRQSADAYDKSLHEKMGWNGPKNVWPQKSPEMRFNEIKTQNPTLTDQQIYAQMAIEEASGK